MASSGCEHHFLLMEELRPKEDLCVHMPESLSDKVKYSSTGFLKQKNVRMFSAGRVVEIICNHSLNKILMSATFMAKGYLNRPYIIVFGGTKVWSFSRLQIHWETII